MSRTEKRQLNALEYTIYILILLGCYASIITVMLLLALTLHKYNFFI